MTENFVSDFEAFAEEFARENPCKRVVFKRDIRITHGTEGPAHDPYGYEEITYTQDELSFTLHNGLDCWVTGSYTGNPVPFVRVGINLDMDYATVHEFFRQMTGLTTAQALKAYNRIHGPKDRCPECGARVASGSGYAGETILYCPDCGKYGWSEEVTDSMIR
jgi:hypothetical protein